MKISPFQLSDGTTIELTNDEYSEVREIFTKKIKEAKDKGEIITPLNVYSLYVEPELMKYMVEKLKGADNCKHSWHDNIDENERYCCLCDKGEERANCKHEDPISKEEHKYKCREGECDDHEWGEIEQDGTEEVKEICTWCDEVRTKPDKDPIPKEETE